jgi:hypothetical protein
VEITPAPVEVAAVQSGQTPLAADECARNPYLKTQAVIDPGTCGSVTSADGSLTVLLPAGQHDRYTLTIAASAVGVSGTPAYGNLQVARQWYMVSVTDSAGNLVVSFDPPMSIVLTPTPCGFALDQGDWNAISTTILDPTTGSFNNVSTAVTPNGLSATAAVTGLAPVPASPAASISCTAAAGRLSWSIRQSVVRSPRRMEA